MTNEYLVRWEINIWADSPQEAAEKARAYQLKQDAQVGAFHVFGELGHRTEVDLDEEVSVEQAYPDVVHPQLCLVGQADGEHPKCPGGSLCCCHPYGSEP